MGASGQTQSALPCRPGNSLVAQGEVPSIGNGTMRQVFFTAGRIFFRAIADFPALGGKSPCHPSQEAGCHKICFYIDPTGLFFTCRTKKISEAPEPRRHPSPATGIPSAQKNFQTALPGLPDRPALQAPARTGHELSPAPAPSSANRKISPSKNSLCGSKQHGDVLPLPRDSPSARRMPCRDPPEYDRQRCTILFGDKNARGGLPSREAPLICFMMT